MHKKTIVTLLILPLLAGCGTHPGDRALSGAGIGAGTGAVGAALLNANPIAGAVIGGGVGALTGAVTSPDQIDLRRK